jgi:hypothetical protein
VVAPPKSGVGSAGSLSSGAYGEKKAFTDKDANGRVFNLR